MVDMIWPIWYINFLEWFLLILIQECSMFRAEQMYNIQFIFIPVGSPHQLIVDKRKLLFLEATNTDTQSILLSPEVTITNHACFAFFSDCILCSSDVSLSVQLYKSSQPSNDIINFENDVVGKKEINLYPGTYRIGIMGFTGIHQLTLHSLTITSGLCSNTGY